LEACPPVKSDLSSLDFVINRFFMKLFKTNNLDVVKSSQQYYNFEIQALLGQNVLHLSKINFQVPRTFSLKIHGTQFNSNDMFM